MKTRVLILALISIFTCGCQHEPETSLSEIFYNPPESAKPWVFWHWIKAAVSKEGITADLEAMKENGTGGACLITVQGVEDPPLYDPPAEQLTPEWWEMVRHAFTEAKRLDLKLAMHSCDGFAVAGGPWITPEMSMQKIVWTEINVTGNKIFNESLPQPETLRGFYNDIGIFAYPTPAGSEYDTYTTEPIVTTNATTKNINYLCDSGNTKIFRSDEPCWIEYRFNKPFTCRTIAIKTNGLNYASHRLIVESSNDGIHYNKICRLEPPRHGWQDYDSDITHSIPETTAKYFRFKYNTENAEPGSEDLDAARWDPVLKIKELRLSGKHVIHQYKGKNGSMWRVSKPINKELSPDSICIPLNNILNISDKVDSLGILNWNVPEGNWTILRIGHTTTGKTNYIGGKGLGLECDKFDPAIVKFQFDQWFGKIFDNIDENITNEVLKVFLIDSWECGSQNWSSVFPEEFKKRRGYDLIPMLPVMTGLPIENSEFSEQVLFDVRQTIDELITDNFFGIMAREARSKNCLFSSESIAPVMVSDAMSHYKEVDMPMGEFWFNSPTHDKPLDVLDAISAGHVYNKNIIQSEAFTTLRMDWSESPAMLKTLGDRNFALGVNRFVFHVFAHNPWMDKKPGMTLNTVGLYFQRDQTWWKESKAWVEYIQRCQALLQEGKPVVDIAVFTGEELPRRAITPDRLIDILPGLFGDETVKREKKRLTNKGAPMIERPYSIFNSANTFDPANWTDALRGYKYDAINKDALIRLAKVEDGRIVLPGGVSYKVLVIPGKRRMNPSNRMSIEVAKKILKLVEDGATIIIAEKPECFYNPDQKKQTLNNETIEKLFEGIFKVVETDEGSIIQKRIGKGRIIKAPFQNETLAGLGIPRDFYASNKNTGLLDNLVWTHRSDNDFDIYFVSNQLKVKRDMVVSFRSSGKVPEIYNPVYGEINLPDEWKTNKGRTNVNLELPPNGSVFIVFEKNKHSDKEKRNGVIKFFKINSTWNVTFNKKLGGPTGPVLMNKLSSWNTHQNDSIKYYSGLANYSTGFFYEGPLEKNKRIWIDLGEVKDIASVNLNGKKCGIAWTYPYKVEITNAIKTGENNLSIDIVNSWKNRIIGDNTLPTNNTTSWTTAPFRIKGQPLAESGLLGPVQVVEELFKD